MSEFQDNIKDLEELADKHIRYLKLAFLYAIVELKKQIAENEDLQAVIENGNIDEIVRISNVEALDDMLHGMNIDKDGMLFNDEVRSVFNAGAMAGFWNLPIETQKMFNYNPIGERAVSFIIQDMAKTANELVETTKAGLRQALIKIVADKGLQGVTVSSVSEFIGLTADQVTAVINFRNQLIARKNLGFTSAEQRRLSEPEQLLIRDHMTSNILTENQINKLVGSYYESLLNKRATDIATTETMRAMNNGLQELWEQGLDQGIFNDDHYRKFWVTMGDKKVRPTHVVIPGMNPHGVKIRSSFLTPWGVCYGPGERNVNLINCRCHVMILLKI